MRIDSDQWAEIVDSLSRNKSRTFLTAFGIFWGVFMLMLLLGGGNALVAALGRSFSGMASNTGFVFASQTSEPYGGFQYGRKWDIPIEDVQRLINTVPEIDVATALIYPNRGNATYREKKLAVNMNSFNDETNMIMPVIPKEGRLLNNADNNQRRKVCMIGKRVRNELFGDSITPLGKYIMIEGIGYQVVGVTNNSGGGIQINGNPEESVYIPLATVQQVYNRTKNIDCIGFTAKKGFAVSDVAEKMAQQLKRMHKISPTDNQAVQKINAEAIFKVVDNMYSGVSALIWLIGVGTLLAGAIGVSNIMLVTVKERTTEIGIRRAIGATPRDILLQIMSESVVLTLLAGMSGICLSVLILALIENGQSDGLLAEANFQVPFGLAVGAALLLSVLGVLAGLGPTIRAMAIKPVDAMREE